MEQQTIAKWPIRIRHCLINSLVFGLCYPLTNWLAQQQHVTHNVAFSFEQGIPFLPWMIIPYASSILFFTLSFAWVRSENDVRLLSQRTVVTTLAAALIFAIFPLQFGMSRPAIDPPVLAPLFDVLSFFDRPYNQLPSLHVAFCVIAWQSLYPLVKHSLARTVLAIWLTLVAISTLLTYQHHVLDVVAGLLLGCLAVLLIRKRGVRSTVALSYCVAAAILWLLSLLIPNNLAPLYLVASLLLVALAYQRDDRHFLRKNNGRYPLWIWLMYAPYLIGYRLTWHCVRLRERGRRPYVQWRDQLLVGRRLSVAEAATLPEHCVVIDLANELSETPSLRRQPYHHFPLLDLHRPAPAVMDQIAAVIAEHIGQGRTVYLHCAMGYSRSKLLAKHFSERFPLHFSTHLPTPLDT
ncbi:MAG: phosphatase PAP2 family protein [Pseudomonadota bacterium]